MIISIRTALFAASLLVSSVFLYSPISAFAQSVPCNWYGNYSSCTTGSLLVYVQVLNTQNQVSAPSNFQIQVTGQASPSTFPGSQSGTLVTLNPGSSYSVSIIQNLGYTPSYSVGCNGTSSAHQQSTCVITMSGPSSFYSYPQPYQYPYQNQGLSCYSAYQSIPLGQTATFTASGGIGNAYNWSSTSHSYQGVGPVLNIGFQSTGTQIVTVENGSQIASCVIRVTEPGTSAYATVITPAYNNPITPTLQMSYIPRLPNTGFEPVSSSELVFGLIILIGTGAYLLPYVRKAFIIAAH